MSSGCPVIVVVGIGNAYRGDDAAGLTAAGLCEASLGSKARVVIGVSDASSLLDLWDAADLCIVIDCAVSGRDAGTIHCFDAMAEPIPPGILSSFSTHAFSVPQAVKLARRLNRLPSRLMVLAIEGTEFSAGAAITPEVGRAAARVAEMVTREVSTLLAEVSYG